MNWYSITIFAELLVIRWSVCKIRKPFLQLILLIAMFEVITNSDQFQLHCSLARITFLSLHYHKNAIIHLFVLQELLLFKCNASKFSAIYFALHTKCCQPYVFELIKYTVWRISTDICLIQTLWDFISVITIAKCLFIRLLKSI